MIQKRSPFLLLFTLLLVGCGENSFSPPGSVVLKATGTQIGLSWQPASAVTGYNVFRSMSSGSISSKIPIATLVQGSHFTDPSPEPGRKYYYQVTAVNPTGNSSPSAELSGSTKPVPPGVALLGGAVQGSALALAPTVAVKAGSVTAGWIDAEGTAARFNRTIAITTDGTNLYVSDYLNNRIRKIVIATGAVSTLAGSGVAGVADGIGAAATFNAPGGITTDGTNLYVTDSSGHTIRRIELATAAVTTLAGSSAAGYADGVGAAAKFSTPMGLTIRGTKLYVADTSNNCIRSIDIATGTVTTVAGSTTSGSANGVGTAASFNAPTGITTDGSRLYVTDRSNNLIRAIDSATGQVSTLAGSSSSGSTDGVGTAAKFSRPSGITTDGLFLYVADFSNNMIRKISIATGEVTTVAGSSTAGSTDGAGSSARFSTPYGVTTDGRSLFVADYANNSIREIY